ncbi:ATP-binding protein [Denitromonas iodatirespirans]|uniref:histidine kinase n=1 Tax=Denitromonas iodatirespirans TaxID=2795389 RepID=A0A944D6P9_DENI1|nr:ATP-binding protein [Denitromonas iodatirespirans]MBT0960944.1 HAMP domain-containing histidine kinase [Denitromonas iodatirespirans]
MFDHPAPSLDDSRPDARQSHVARLITLRWYSVLAMIALAVGAAPALDIHIPAVPIVMIAGALGLWNLLLLKGLSAPNPPGPWSILLELVVDLAAWSGVLYLTGGATNPLISLFLPLIAVGAAVLPVLHTWLLSALSIGIYSWLWVHHQPLGLADPTRAIDWHLAGMWGTFAVSALVMTWYVSRMTSAVRARDHALAQARERRLRNERIVAMANLAAGAAHEMGTPLGTMRLIVDSLRMQCDDDGEIHEDLVVMEQQIAHCRSILSRLTASGGQARVEAGGAIAAADWLGGVLATIESQRPDVTIDRAGIDTLAGLRMIADQSLTQAMHNLVNNAATASPDRHVAVSAGQTQGQLEIRLADRGPGIAPDILDALHRAPAERPTSSNGLGIGLLLSLGAIESFGGTLRYAPRDGGGTITTVTLPLLNP